jgi:H+/Cl- antiporter ClcA
MSTAIDTSARRRYEPVVFSVLVVLLGLGCGGASGIFLALLEYATELRGDHEWLVYCLPVAGLAIGWLYERFGQPIKAGNNLVIDTIHDGGPQLPLRMAPMVLVGTVLTHVFGGSAGREGTAVQIGAGLADQLAFRARLAPRWRRQLLAAGVAGGFGSVFGTPAAGAIFGLEFVVLGRVEYEALLPAFTASIVGDLTTRALGIRHAQYPVLTTVPLTPLLILRWCLFALVVAAVSGGFIELTHAIKRYGERWLGRLPWRMALGGLTVVGMWRLVGTSDYLGLGVPMIQRSFEDPTLPHAAFALKWLFTAVTLGAGFMGGEVTPLFFVGAALGNACAGWLGVPLELAAGVGLAAVFAAAANTPWALSIMAVELLGSAALPHVLIVCVLAYVISGRRRSIYPAQRGLAHHASEAKANPPAT